MGRPPEGGRMQTPREKVERMEETHFCRSEGTAEAGGAEAAAKGAEAEEGACLGAGMSFWAAEESCFSGLRSSNAEGEEEEEGEGSAEVEEEVTEEGGG